MINLGDEVEDKITGFRGLVFAEHTFLFGTTTISVQPQVEQYGILPKGENFFEGQLKVIKKYKLTDTETIDNNKCHIKKFKKE